MRRVSNVPCAKANPALLCVPIAGICLAGICQEVDLKRMPETLVCVNVVQASGMLAMARRATHHRSIQTLAPQVLKQSSKFS